MGSVKTGRFPAQQLGETASYPQSLLSVEVGCVSEHALVATFENLVLREVFLEGEGGPVLNFV